MDSNVHDDAHHKQFYKGELWGKDGALQEARRRFHIAYRRGGATAVSGLSALSSAYYTAAGNAAAMFRTSGWPYKPFWGLRAWYCFRKAVKLSDSFAQKRTVAEMSAGKITTRASILEKDNRWEAALHLARAGLERTDLSEHDRFLLLLNRARAEERIGMKDDAALDYILARNLIEAGLVNEEDAVRGYRALAEYHGRQNNLEHARKFKSLGLGLAHKNGWGDQIVKLEALRF